MMEQRGEIIKRLNLDRKQSLLLEQEVDGRLIKFRIRKPSICDFDEPLLQSPGDRSTAGQLPMVELGPGEPSASPGAPQLAGFQPDEVNVRRMQTALSLNEAILKRSSSAKLVIINLPGAPKESTPEAENNCKWAPHPGLEPPLDGRLEEPKLTTCRPLPSLPITRPNRHGVRRGHHRQARASAARSKWRPRGHHHPLVAESLLSQIGQSAQADFYVNKSPNQRRARSIGRRAAHFAHKLPGRKWPSGRLGRSDHFSIRRAATQLPGPLPDPPHLLIWAPPVGGRPGSRPRRPVALIVISVVVIIVVVQVFRTFYRKLKRNGRGKQFSRIRWITSALGRRLRPPGLQPGLGPRGEPQLEWLGAAPSSEIEPKGWPLSGRRGSSGRKLLKRRSPPERIKGGSSSNKI